MSSLYQIITKVSPGRNNVFLGPSAHSWLTLKGYLKIDCCVGMFQDKLRILECCVLSTMLVQNGLCLNMSWNSKDSLQKVLQNPLFPWLLPSTFSFKVSRPSAVWEFNLVNGHLFLIVGTGFWTETNYQDLYLTSLAISQSWIGFRWTRIKYQVQYQSHLLTWAVSNTCKWVFKFLPHRCWLGVWPYSWYYMLAN